MIADELAAALARWRQLPAAPGASESCRRKTAALPSKFLAGTAEIGGTATVKWAAPAAAAAGACLTPTAATAAASGE